MFCYRVLGDADTIIVGYTDIYGRLLGKRYDVDNYFDTVHKDGTHACTYSLAVDMGMNPLEGFDLASWSTGFGDFHLVPDVSSARRAAWLDKTVLVLCDIHDNTSDELLSIAPRSVLQTQVSNYGAMFCVSK